VNVVVVVSAPVEAVPAVGWPPLHPPDAVHVVALVELHVSVEAPPIATLVGSAVKVTDAGGITVTATVLLPVPPGPVHVNVKLVVLVSAPVAAVPLAGLLPLHPPEAVHVVALVELQVSVDASPTNTLVGFADRLTVGAGTTVTVTLRLSVPPVPVHISVKVVVEPRAPVEAEPLVDWLPLHPPDAVQVVALVVFQFSVAEPLIGMLSGVAVSVTVGGGTTVTVMLCEPLPPMPAHVRAKLAVDWSGPVEVEPLVG
jgi:hypothetical protein